MQIKIMAYLGIFLLAAGLVMAQQDTLRNPSVYGGPINNRGQGTKNQGYTGFQEVTATAETPTLAFPDATLVGAIAGSTNVAVTGFSGMTAGRLYYLHLNAASTNNLVFTKSASLRFTSTNATVTLSPTNIFTVLAVDATTAKILVPASTATVP